MNNSQSGWVVGAIVGPLALLVGASAQAASIPIDLNGFYADPTVTVAADGASARLAEDAGFAEVFLANDPGLGDPFVIVPGVGVSLLFGYEFVEAVGEDDEFGAFVIDAVTGVSVGSAYEFFVESTGSGLVRFDLSALVGQTLGLQFQLSKLSADNGNGSTATVSNVRLEARIPTPGSLALLASGLLGLIRINRPRRRSVQRLARRRHCRGRGDELSRTAPLSHAGSDRF